MPPDANDIVIQSNRVALRFPRETDRAEYITLRRTNRPFLEQWEPIPPEGFDAFGDDAFDRERQLADTSLEKRLLIFDREYAAIAGRISIGAIERGPLQSARIGYWLGESFTGKGLMSEAISLTLRYAFDSLELHRITANIQPHNLPSRAAVRRIGFRLEGYSPNYLKIQGKWADHERWAITAEDHRSRQKSPDENAPNDSPERNS